MKRQTWMTLTVTALIGLLAGGTVQAETITHGSTTINMDFVTIGNPGNTADTAAHSGNPAGQGAVNYVYNIGKYEVTADQWATIIAADANVGNAGYWSGSQPTGGASWYEAAKFCNWLTSGSAATGVYTFTGSIASPTGVTIDRSYRNADGVAYFLSNEDEWYKAAYYNGSTGIYYDYPTGSNSEPDGINFDGDMAFDAVFRQDYNQGHPNAVTNAGVASPYGTIGQGGNVFEWNETAIDSTPLRGLRGGCWASDSSVLLASTSIIGTPAYEDTYGFFGFRVASVPEPGSIMLAVAGGLCLLFYAWRWRRQAT